MSQERMARINRAVQEALAEIVGTELSDPRITALDVLGVSVVKTSPDLRQAKVSLTMTGSPEERRGALIALRQARGRLRHALGRKVQLRYTPELIFVIDEVEATATRVEEILRDIAADEGEHGA